MTSPVGSRLSGLEGIDECPSSPHELSLISKASPRNSVSIGMRSSFLQKSQISASEKKIIVYYKNENLKLKKSVRELKAENGELTGRLRQLESRKFESKLDSSQKQKKYQKYRKRVARLSEKLAVMTKKHENLESQVTFLEKLVKDYKIKVKKLAKAAEDSERTNEELTQKIMDFIRREQELMAKNEKLMRRIRQKRSTSPRRAEQSPKIKVWRMSINSKAKGPKDSGERGERFTEERPAPPQKSKFSFSSLFSRK